MQRITLNYTKARNIAINIMVEGLVIDEFSI
jgi:hypothetical protein